MNRKKKVLFLVVALGISLFVLAEGPGLALHMLGMIRQGKVDAVLAEAATPIDEAAGGQPLDEVTIGCPGCRNGTYAIQDVWAEQVTGQLDDEGHPEYRFVFDEAGFNRFFQTWLSQYLQDRPYRNIWFELRDGGMVVYADVNSNPSGDFNLPPGAPYLGIVYGNTQEGIVVNSVLPLGPADLAGLQVGDIIYDLDGTPAAEVDCLPDWIQAHSPGDVVTLSVMREEQPTTVQVKLEEWSDDARWHYVGLVLAPDVTGSRLVPIGVSLGDDLYSLPQSGPMADAVAEAERMLDDLMDSIVVVGPLDGEAHVTWLGLAEDSFTIVAR